MANKLGNGNNNSNSSLATIASDGGAGADGAALAVVPVPAAKARRGSKPLVSESGGGLDQHGTSLATASNELVRCAFFDRSLHLKMPLVPTLLLRLKLLHACV
jgi:hypothetical protein